MWFLYAIEGGQETTRTLLRPGTMYTLGRREADILPPIIEKSISRKHATLTIEKITAENWNDLDGKPSVHFHDLSSKYGSFINSVRVDGVSLDQGVFLKDGDSLKIGTKTALFRLSWQPLTICRQPLPAADKQKLVNDARQIGAKVTQSIRSPYTHLFMSSVQISFKVARCLAEGKPIVSQKWLDTLVNLPDQDYKFPPVADYLPPIDASCNGVFGVPDFTPNHNRALLFTGKCFVFFEEEQYQQLASLIETCGGQCQLLNIDQVDSYKEQLGNENTIAVSCDKLYETQTGKNITNALNSLQKGLVNNMEICWAILYCSTDLVYNSIFDPSSTGSTSRNNPPTFNETRNTSAVISPPPPSATHAPSNANLVSSTSGSVAAPDTSSASSSSFTKRKRLSSDHQTPDQAPSKPAAKPIIDKGNMGLDLEAFFDHIVGDEPSRPAPTPKHASPASSSSRQPILQPAVNDHGSDNQENNSDNDNNNNDHVSITDEMAIDEQPEDRRHVDDDDDDDNVGTKVTIDKGKGRMYEPASLSINDNGALSVDDEMEGSAFSTGRKSKKSRTGKNTNSNAQPPPVPRKPFILPELENENVDITTGKAYTKVIYTSLVVAPSPPENWTSRQRQQRQQVSGGINYKKFKKVAHPTPIDPLYTVGMVAGIPPDSEESEPLLSLAGDDFSDIRIRPNASRGKMWI